jgi:hypothetical protein
MMGTHIVPLRIVIMDNTRLLQYSHREIEITTRSECLTRLKCPKIAKRPEVSVLLSEQPSGREYKISDVGDRRSVKKIGTHA